ncbi:SagB/ThcOx family dehydrogenase [Bacillus subtilis]|nr:SagB/ThcOx family dehydrogenase [Bacillus subtilis]MDM5302499.1 SagB/ThcOx family dehydrogenase [Bacillus subtilis]MDM5324552.1 SagB/ThcOx family dehydrogenase [Bacillus subtilis]
MKWDFSFNLDDTRNRYRNYHRASSHSPLMQMKKAPRREYEVKNLDSVGKTVKFKIDPNMFNDPSNMSFKEVIKNRRTSWSFAGKDLTEGHFKELMLYSFGISNEKEKKRTYPSGGQFYSIEIYMIPTKRTVATGLFDEKVYKFNVNRYEIVEMGEVNIDSIDRISASTDVGLFSLEQVQFIIFLVGNDKDLSIKYMDLSYRIMLLEAGHMAQNFLLSCTFMGINSVPLGGYHESEIKEILNLPKNQMVLYTLLGG